MEDAKEVVCVDFNTNIFFKHIFLGWYNISSSYRYIVSHDHNMNGTIYNYSSDCKLMSAFEIRVCFG